MTSFPKFAPASNTADAWSASEIIDLNDIFADDFFPADLDFSSLLQGDFLPSFGSDVDVANNSSANTSSLSSLGKNPASIGQGINPLAVNRPILVPPVMPSAPIIPAGATSSNKKSGTGKGGRASDANKGKAVPTSLESIIEMSNERHHDDDDDDDDDDEDDDERGHGKVGGKRKKAKAIDPKDMTEEQRLERRERNREHAKKSRIRKRVLLSLLQDQLSELRRENVQLRRVVIQRLPEKAAQIFETCTTEESQLLHEHELEGADHIGGADMDKYRDTDSLHQLQLKPHPDEIAATAAAVAAANERKGEGVLQLQASQVQVPSQRARILMEPDFRLMESLIHSQQNFVLSDPSLPDNPIVYCSEGFCKLTGYKRQEVLGRNCRFLQGPGTDQNAVDIIRRGIVEGRDISVCLLNYKKDGSPFWNQFFVGALRDASGNVVNYVGIQCEVNLLPLEEISARVKRLPLPDSL